MGDILWGRTDHCFETTLPIAGEAKYTPSTSLFSFLTHKFVSALHHLPNGTRAGGHWTSSRKRLIPSPGGSSLPPSKALLE